MATNTGRFVWYEDLAKDPKAAIDFYSDVVGWKTQPFEGNKDYVMWVGSQGPLGGVMKLPDEVSKMGSSVALKKRAERVMAGLPPFIATVARVPLEHRAEKPLLVLVNMVAQPGSSIFCSKTFFSRSTTLTEDEGCML